MKIPPLIVALDIPDHQDLPAWLARMPREITWYKVGLELFTAAGPSVVNVLKNHGKRVFLDLKLHDIPRTVARAVDSAIRIQADLLTVHASGGRAMLSAAAQAAKSGAPHNLKLIAVTTLTSLHEADFVSLGISRSVSSHTSALGQLAMDSGLDGLVASVHELTLLRQQFGPGPILVTPGIRLRPADGASPEHVRLRSETTPGQVRTDGQAADDQKRIATPTQAVRGGADFLVVGRPILDAPDPARAAKLILSEIRQAAAGG